MSGKNFMSYGDADTILTEFSNDIKSRVSIKANQGLTAQQIANAKANIDIEKVPNVATNDQTPTFLEESTRTNIASGDTLSLIFGKIKKFFSDLKTVAFTGSYNDLSDKIAFDNVPTQNSDNAVKSGGVFSTMAVPKYDSANRREYYEGGSAFSGNIDSVPTAGSNNAVASGGTYSKLITSNWTSFTHLLVSSCTLEGFTGTVSSCQVDGVYTGNAIIATFFVYITSAVFTNVNYPKVKIQLPYIARYSSRMLFGAAFSSYADLGTVYQNRGENAYLNTTANSGVVEITKQNFAKAAVNGIVVINIPQVIIPIL